MSLPTLVVVDGIKPVASGPLDNLRDKALSFALDQRAFGPRKLWVAIANAKGRFRGLAYTERTDPALIAVEACLAYLDEHMHRDAVAAVVFCDEPVTDGPAAPEFGERFAAARELAATFGVHLVDWFACDDELFRSARYTLPDAGDQRDWWDVPPIVLGTRRANNPRAVLKTLL